ncbi:heterokaryon incompatibility protein-domain-containing protein [Podospora didyma]|uniref:Heterokaryon incompatibility protein-domain-containing protein n=1 Tax=Podospora didyma TaxID=330526 RepID=A0AAE0NTG5_9PEZI|nr:heterokaryon incompatibility protein-domain-containing protein [Podospora didyma]
MSAPSRIYADLPLRTSRQIRLLKLEWKKEPFLLRHIPAFRRRRMSSSINGYWRLDCTITVASLDDSPDFHALSYAWESQAATEALICNNYELLVTRNCCSALHSIAQDEWSRSCFFWVDSICIDQDSIAERNHQVTLMADIYKTARVVDIWLGEADQDSLGALKELEFLTWLAKADRVQGDRRMRALQKIRKDQVSSVFKDRNLALPYILVPEDMVSFTHPLSPILGRTWFGRLWTLQEIVLASVAVVRLGAHSMTWSDLCDVDNQITVAEVSLGLTQYPSDIFQRVRIVADLRIILGMEEGLRYGRRWQYNLPHDHPFGPISMKRVDPLPRSSIGPRFFLSCKLAAADPRDKLFGQFGILQEHGICLATPDYHKPLSTLYQEASRAIITHDSTLELLYFTCTEGGSSGQNLPSWAPDLSYDWFPWIPDWAFTAASQATEARFQFSECGSLTVYGVPIDVVIEQTRSIDTTMPNTDWSTYPTLNRNEYVSKPKYFRKFIPVMESLRSWITFALECHTEQTEHAHGLLCQVLLQEVAQAFGADPEKWTRLQGRFSIWCELLKATENHEMEWESEPRTGLISEVLTKSSPATGDDYPDSGLELLVEQLYNQLILDDTSRTVHHIVLTRAKGNCLFRSLAGKLGIASRKIQKGDEVFLIAGSALPMILRRRKTGYRIIGPAYIPGVMQGEMWPQGGQGLTTLELI